MGTTAPRADAAAASVGASDLFVLRRAGDDRFVHFGGAGRGSGWAGLIEVTSSESDALRESLETRAPVRLGPGDKELVFGPYYARAAAFVAVSNDLVVVFGAEEDELERAADEDLRGAAASAAAAVEQISPAKQLADELEELEAVRAALAVDTTDLEETMRSLARVAAEALSCELAAVFLAEANSVVVVDRGWRLGAEPDAVAAALRGVLDEGRFPYCVQDASVVPLPAPLDEERGVRSYYLLELEGLARGVLFVAHTDADPRGFTLLCRKLGLRLAEVASAQIGVALTRAWCRGEAARLHAAFGRLDAG